MKHKQEIDSFIISLFIGVLPILMLSIGHTSTMFYAILVVSLTMCFSRPGGFNATLQDWSRYRWLAAGLFSIMLVIVMVMLVDHRVMWSALERTIRIGAGTFIVLGACLSLRPQWMRQSIWGMAFASGMSASISLWLTWPNFARPDVPEYNAVSYGNLALLTTTLTTFSLGWKLTSHHKTETAIKSTLIAMGFLGFILTQTRSGWLAIPSFMVIGVVLLRRLFSIKKICVIFLSICVLVSASYLSSPTLKFRMGQAINEVIECFNYPLTNSSVCIRLQLWRASWEMFKQDPLLGNNGSDKFGDALKLLHDKNIVSKFVVDEKFEEPHNDIFYAMASYGLLGLISLFLIYFSPGWIFLRRLISQQSIEIRIAAAMGLSVCVGFFVFGLTELMFRGMRTMGFYAVTIAWLLALSDPIFLQRESDKKPVR